MIDYFCNENVHANLKNSKKKKIMAYGKSKDLTKRTESNKVLRENI